MNRPEPVRLGVLGCADIAWRRTLPAVLAEPRLRLVAVASRDGGRARRFADRFGAAPVTGYDRLLDRDDIDAVYVPLPAALLPRWVDAALATGRHVLAEKPLGRTGAEARELVVRATAGDLVLMENAAFQLHPQHEEARRLVAAGEIGPLRTVTSVFGISPLPPEDIRYRPELGGGALLDVGFYPLRTAQMFLGPELRVVGAHLHTGPSGVDIAGSALLAAPDGVAAAVSFGFGHAYRNAYELWGGDGRLVLERAFTPPPEHRPELSLHGPAGVRRRTLRPHHQFAALAADFAAAVTTRRDLRRHHDEVIGRAALAEAVRRHAGVEVR
ncbi:Predicted dehydrogenase [Micromonospora chaiyaphumensis]|uniref:Predicted dehydrogenase n=1 Tax=Micromonospora chaiyaphumensis TaxID=307119 RepID=A0A1C4VZI1_9ACTN|nr:Predicted dehydrogenase [Micromonospora chaiyaphumensis]